jgi:hypothetical protein
MRNDSHVFTCMIFCNPAERGIGAVLQLAEGLAAWRADIGGVCLPLAKKIRVAHGQLDFRHPFPLTVVQFLQIWNEHDAQVQPFPNDLGGLSRAR